VSDLAKRLEDKLRTGDAHLGTLGLGYVGLPLSVEFATGGLRVTGFDLSPEKVAAVNRGESYIKDVPSDRLKALVDAKKLDASSDFNRLAECDAVIICVPTPLGKTKDPDLTMVVDAAKAIAERLKPGQLAVVYVGRIAPEKNLPLAVRTFREVQKIRHDARYVWVGDGPSRAALAAENPDFIFAGIQRDANLARHFASADLFVLASVIIERSGKRDVIPNVLAEAMAMRLPVVATSVSGITELVTDGVSGRLVGPNDPAALARVIAELLDDPAQRQRLAAEGAATVARMFDREVNIEELAALFRGAVGAARGAA